MHSLVVRDQLHMLLRGSQCIGLEEKQVIMTQIESNKMFRETLCDSLNEMCTGRNLEN